MSFQNHLSQLFSRDLQRINAELEAYQSEENLWLVKGDISNSAGNLALHIAGNLQHFIGALLGNTGYERDRSNEFGLKGAPRTSLLQLMLDTEEVVVNTLSNLEDKALAEVYPIGAAGRKWTTDAFLMHLYGHLNYHLGQINYHRRLVEKK